MPHEPAPLRPALNRLEELLASVAPEALPAELRRLAEPERLQLLFQLELRAIVRAGPKAADPQLTPERLLTVAQQAARNGALPLATPTDLRRTLRRLARRLRDAGAWHGGRDLWWSPLSGPNLEESIWKECYRLADALPSRRRLSTAFAASPDAPHWRSLPHLLPPDLIVAVFGELEAASHLGVLDLARAGVGVDGRITASRSDSVRYLSGHESEVLDAAPAFAALVQWCLANLGDLLADGLPGAAIFPPARAMLAHYPAPSGGYHPHLDNPGGARDNGRALTLVLYLNGPGEECAGGEIVLWAPGAATSDPPAAVLPPRSGSAVLFDARTVAHQVQPLAAGPARWALTLWLNDAPQRPAPPPPPPEPSLTDALLPIDDPPLPLDTVLFHELGHPGPAGRLVVRRVTSAAPRVGIVSTVYRQGDGLDAWCDHHFALGVDHLVLVFDHLEEPGEAADADRLSSRWGAERLTVWSGARLGEERWPALPRALRAELESTLR